MTRTIRYHCPHCDKPLGPAEVVEQWCNRCERDAIPAAPTEASRAEALDEAGTSGDAA